MPRSLDIRSKITLAGAIVLLVLCALPAAAQDKVDLRGRVVEMGTARPLAGAEVVLPALDRFALTNAEGAFAMRGVEPGTYRVEVTQLGYRTWQAELDVRADAPVTIELSPDPVVLERLTAQVNRLEQRRNALPVTVRVASRDRLLSAIDMESAIRGTGEFLTRCGTGICLFRRGRYIVPRVYIDERPAFGIDELNAYRPSEFHSIEVIDHSTIRAYTVWFMERLAIGKASLFPVLF